MAPNGQGNNQTPGGWNLLKQKVTGFLVKFGEWWKSVRQWYQLLQPARACLLASLLVPGLFIGVDQGRDTLRLVASEGVSWHAFWMIAGMWVAGLASWGWARFLLNCEFPTSEEAREISKDEDRSEKARLVLRRICGLLPPLGMAAGFLFAADNSGCIGRCVILAVISVAVAAALWFSFEPLRRWHTRLNKAARGSGPRLYRFKNLDDVRADTFSKWAIIAAWTVSAVIFVTLTCWPVVFGEALGSPAVILFAIAVWISTGSAVIYVACLYRVPILTVLLLWAMFCSFFNDNHDVRILPAHAGTSAPPRIFTALDQWHESVTKDYPLTDSSRKRPLYMVASAGGGIRAAYWTATVLGELEDCARNNGTSFASHTFIMSGVSGGSLGEVTFVALLVHGGQTNFMGNARKLLNDDFLAADLAKMAFADLLQRFMPFPVTHFDRARSLEDAWAAAWVDEFHTNVLDESVGQLYADATNAKMILPHLLLNGTCVETGQRIITSDLTVRARVMAKGRSDSSGNFLDIIPAADKLSNAPIRLSTAAHQSARFTYFSPAGRFSDGTHIVDGGYFENSGASTLMDALNAIQWYIGFKKWTNVEPRLILIDNEPVPLESKTVPSRFLRETLSPIRTLFNTRTARGNYAVEQALDYNWRSTNVYQFDLYERPESEPLGQCQTPGNLPLGWTLSQCAMNEMDAQLTLPFQRATNSLIISNIVAALPRYAPAGE